MTSQRLSEKSDETKLFMCRSTERLACEQKDRFSKYILISPAMGRDENVLMCFLLTEFDNNFDSYQKRSLTDVVALGNCN